MTKGGSLADGLKKCRHTSDTTRFTRGTAIKPNETLLMRNNINSQMVCSTRNQHESQGAPVSTHRGLVPMFVAPSSRAIQGPDILQLHILALIAVAPRNGMVHHDIAREDLLYVSISYRSDCMAG